MTIAILEALYLREAVSHGIQIQICFASCLSGETTEKISFFNFMDHKAFIFQLEVFEINSSYGFHLPFTSSADPYFFT